MLSNDDITEDARAMRRNVRSAIAVWGLKATKIGEPIHRFDKVPVHNDIKNRLIGAEIQTFRQK